MFGCSKRRNNFTFHVAEGHCFPEVYFDVTMEGQVSHQVGKNLERSFFKFMHKWDKWHRYSIRYICLDKIFEETSTVRIAVDFGWCKQKIVKALVKHMRKSSFPITSVIMHSEG